MLEKWFSERSTPALYLILVFYILGVGAAAVDLVNLYMGL